MPFFNGANYKLIFVLHLIDGLVVSYSNKTYFQYHLNPFPVLRLDLVKAEFDAPSGQARPPGPVLEVMKTWSDNSRLTRGAKCRYLPLDPMQIQ